MSAPDPTAGEGKFERQSRRSGERLANLQPGSFTMTRPLVSPDSPPAVAASTGTSEDMEALADETLDSLEARLAADSHDRLRAIVENPALTGDDCVRTRRDDMRAALAPILAAREAAARAEERERIAQAIEADRPGPERDEEPGNWKRGARHARLRAARIAREVRP